MPDSPRHVALRQCSVAVCFLNTLIYKGRFKTRKKFHLQNQIPLYRNRNAYNLIRHHPAIHGCVQMECRTVPTPQWQQLKSILHGLKMASVYRKRENKVSIGETPKKFLLFMTKVWKCSRISEISDS